MRTRAIRSGIRLTELGVGVAQFGNLYQATSDEISTGAVDAAWAAGIRYFDTAPHYGLGLSERRLGQALRRHPRGDYLVSTKVGRLLQPTPENAAQLDPEGFVVPAVYERQWDFSRDGILRSLEQSLDRLGMDRVDIVYLHDPDDHWAAASTSGIDTLIELRDEGVIKAVGAGMNQTAMLVEFARRCDVDLLMVAGRLTLLDPSGIQDLIPIASERGIGIVAAAVYNSGLLSHARVPDDAKYDYGDAPAALVEKARRIAEVCETHGVTLPDAAVQYPLRVTGVTSVVLGTRTSEHVNSNLGRYRTQIPEALWVDLVDAGLIPKLVERTE